MFCTKIHRFHIDGKDAVKFVFGHLCCGFVAMRGSSVVHEDVEPPPVVNSSLNHHLHVRVLADVGNDGDGVLTYFGGNSLCGISVDVGHNDLRTFLCKADGDAASKSGTSSGDDGHFTFESHVIRDELRWF